jgi:hypothetical protein
VFGGGTPLLHHFKIINTDKSRAITKKVIKPEQAIIYGILSLRMWCE